MGACLTASSLRWLFATRVAPTFASLNTTRVAPCASARRSLPLHQAMGEQIRRGLVVGDRVLRIHRVHLLHRYRVARALLRQHFLHRLARHERGQSVAVQVTQLLVGAEEGAL